MEFNSEVGVSIGVDVPGPEDARPDVLVGLYQNLKPSIPRLEGSGATAAIPCGDDASASARRSAIPMAR